MGHRQQPLAMIIVAMDRLFGAVLQAAGIATTAVPETTASKVPPLTQLINLKIRETILAETASVLERAAAVLAASNRRFVGG
mmetsp:Transcript_38256/g.112030  ORF Transcript_38256/g.112030 Transcript_38256/m.112030 type:complete len:82 (-) Transcript_38256:536-781(-)